MKKTLLFSVFLLFGLTSGRSLFAQCEFLAPGVELNSVTTSSPNCIVNLNLRFTINRNNGNKYTYIHLWRDSQHPNINYSNKGPDGTALGAVLATIALEWSGNNVATLMNSYSPDNNIIPLFTGVTVSQTNAGSLYTVTLSNLSFPIPGACSSIPLLKGDVWGTQANSQNPAVHCFNKDFSLSIVDPAVSGQIACNDPSGPRTYSLDVTTTNAVSSNVTYKIYLDDGVKTGGLTNFTPADQLIFTSPPTSLSASDPIHVDAASYTYTTGQDQRTLWVEVSGTTLPNSIIAELQNTCLVALPVKLAKFKGDLLGDRIGLSWVTTEETGSQNFEIERSADMKEFLTIGNVNAAGTSEAIRNYQFSDESPLKGVNYYRLRQVDADGSYEFSRIISVANDETALTFELLGNPVVNGEIKFTLANAEPGQVSLTDIMGRPVKFGLVKQKNTYSVKGQRDLAKGLYFLSVQQGEKVVTKKVLFL